MYASKTCIACNNAALDDAWGLVSPRNARLLPVLHNTLPWHAGDLQGQHAVLPENLWQDEAPRMEPVILEGCDFGPACER